MWRETPLFIEAVDRDANGPVDNLIYAGGGSALAGAALTCSNDPGWPYWTERSPRRALCRQAA